MDAQAPARALSVWRDRLAGRVPFDASAAEAAVRRIYQVSDLPEPRQVICVKGPQEAAQAVAFVENPPRRLRWVALAIIVLGAAALVSLVGAVGETARDGQALAANGLWSVILAGSGLIVASTRRIPLPPGVPNSRLGAKVIFAYAFVFLVLMGFLFGLLSLGVPPDPVGRAVTLALAAAVGTLPGVLSWLRMRRAYAHLPSSLLKVLPSASVANALTRAQRSFRSSSQQTAVGPRSDESLLEAHRSAYREAFAQEGRNWTRFSGIGGDVARNLNREPFREIPQHWEGIAATAGYAAAAARADAAGVAAPFAELAFHVDCLYPFAKTAVAMQPATTVMLDAQGRPHAEDGPALAWEDGTRLYAWHGRIVASDVVERGRPITRTCIDRETDSDRRWVLIERYGLGRYLLESGADEIQSDECGRLYRLFQHLRETIVAVRVVNHTPEPDGSLREFWLAVPPRMATAREAVAWTFGLSAEDYEPGVQS